MTFQVKQLQTTDIQAYINLQNQVIEQTRLPCGQYAMKKRGECQLKNHINSGMPIVGIFNGERQLMAATLVTYPDNKAAQHVDNYPLEEPLSKIFIIHGLCVSPNSQGQGLSKELIAQAFNTAGASGRFIGYAKYASSRQSPKYVFEKAGFKVVKLDLGDKDQYGVTYVRKIAESVIIRSIHMPLSLPAG